MVQRKSFLEMYVVPDSWKSLDTGRLRKHLQASGIEKRRLPDYIRLVEDLPRLDSGGSLKPRDFLLLSDETNRWEYFNKEKEMARKERMAEALAERLSEGKISLPSETEGFHVRQALDALATVVSEEMDDLESRIGKISARPEDIERE